MSYWFPRFHLTWDSVKTTWIIHPQTPVEKVVKEPARLDLLSPPCMKVLRGVKWHCRFQGRRSGPQMLLTAAVHEVVKSWTRLSDFTLFFHFHALEKEMATHSSILAWRIPGTAEPRGLPSMGSHRVGHDWSDAAAAAAPPFYKLYV